MATYSLEQLVDNSYVDSGYGNETSGLRKKQMMQSCAADLVSILLMSVLPEAIVHCRCHKTNTSVDCIRSTLLL